ncbi:hypothetical protein BDF14DRAFT_1216362 [Spinellus fusiger]|nr:hypothetical protein BDF14DRAFT_1216362 [Spinellus fusiger]
MERNINSRLSVSYGDASTKPRLYLQHPTLGKEADNTTQLAGKKRTRSESKNENESPNTITGSVSPTERLRGQSSHENNVPGLQKNSIYTDRMRNQKLIRNNTSLLTNQKPRTPYNTTIISVTDRVGISVDSRMFIRQLPGDASKWDFQVYFEKYGRVLEVSFKNNYGFVQFDSPEACQAAVAAENGRHFKGTNLVLEICRHKPCGMDDQHKTNSRLTGVNTRLATYNPHGLSPVHSLGQKRHDHSELRNRNAANLLINVDSIGRGSQEHSPSEDKYENKSPYAKSDCFHAQSTHNIVRGQSNIYSTSDEEVKVKDITTTTIKYDNQTGRFTTSKYRNMNKSTDHDLYSDSRSKLADEYQLNGRRQMKDDTHSIKLPNSHQSDHETSQGRSDYQEHSPYESRTRTITQETHSSSTSNTSRASNTSCTSRTSRTSHNPPRLGSSIERNGSREATSSLSEPHSPHHVLSSSDKSQNAFYSHHYDNDFPPIQAIIWGDVNTNFVDYIENTFKTEGIPIHTRFLQYGMISRDAIVKQMIVEGVRALIIVESEQEMQGKVYLQVFEQNKDNDTNSVRFDEYDSISVKDAVIIVQRAQQTVLSPLSTLLTQTYNQNNRGSILPIAQPSLHSMPNPLAFGAAFSPNSLLSSFAPSTPGMPSTISAPMLSPANTTVNYNTLAALFNLMHNSTQPIIPFSGISPEIMQQLIVASSTPNPQTPLPMLLILSPQPLHKTLPGLHWDS